MPLAVFAELSGDNLSIRGLVGRPDGSEVLRGEAAGAAADVDRLADAVASTLLAQGADRIIAALSGGGHAAP